MNPRRIARRLMPALIAIAVGAPTAQAWTRNREVPRWPSSVVRYWVDAPAYRDEVAEAVAAINRSGARVRLVRATSRRAGQIIAQANYDQCRGLTDYGPLIGRIGPGGRERLRRLGPTLVKFGPCRTSPETRFLASEARLGTMRLITHEFLHALTLGHESRRCALMNPRGLVQLKSGNPVPVACLDAQQLPVDSSYCALLEPDDQRGLIAIYGGTRRTLGPRVCPRASPPPVEGLVGVPGTTTYGEAAIVLSWSRIGAPISRLDARAQQGACPTEPWAGFLPGNAPAGGSWFPPGPSSLAVPLPAPGSWCIAVATSWTLASSELHGPVATITVELPQPG